MPKDAVVVPDAHLLFHGDFKRSGVDLILSGDDREIVLHDYFKGEKRAALASPDGAHLTGDLVSALTGSVQVSQADGSTSVAKVIGHVTKLVGTATAIRNGVSIILHQGDNVEKGDVVQSGSDSTLGVTFIDGTVFGLSSNARMVLNEMVYDPNGSNNSSLISLVAGTISFVAGQTAKHGDMKIDTPVATMGIRGTAVLVEIDFTVPGAGGQPDAKFQVLVEPDGTTGSYVLFDKTTLQPLAVVNQAGQQINISQGVITQTNAPLSPDVQKLINDVFTLKFTDNTNPKTNTGQNDSITPQEGPVQKADNGTTATPIYKTASLDPGSNPTGNSGGPIDVLPRIPGPPDARLLDLAGNLTTGFSVAERAGITGDANDLDSISAKVTFTDPNAGDTPTVQVNFSAFAYLDTQHHDVTTKLSLLQLADIAKTQVNIAVVPAPGNNNNGSASFTYSVPDKAFDFLAAGETLTLIYVARVDNNFAPFNETARIQFTITVTGTNDQPVITTGPQTVAFHGGTSEPGGSLPLTSNDPTSGTLTFTDVDLTDTHTVSVKLTSPVDSIPPAPLAFFEQALSAKIAADSTGTGAGTVSWTLADIPVYDADFIPAGETLTLTYTVTVTDEHGATSTQTVTVTIKGTDAPAVVWIATTTGENSGGLWSNGSNWETGLAPTASDDVIIITDQLHGLTPSFPVTIDAPAVANSVTMNDYDVSKPGHKRPELDNNSTLSISGALTLKADSVLLNSGTLKFGGGDFKDQASITNSGTLEVTGKAPDASDDNVLNVSVDIDNSGTIQIDAGARLVVNPSTITGGTVTVNGILEFDGTSFLKSGTLNDYGTVDVKGSVAFDAETIANSGLIEIFDGAALTLDLASTLTNSSGGALTVDGGGKLTLDGATIDGGVLTNKAGGEIDLAGSGVLQNGSLGNGGTIKISGSGNALHHETITTNALLDVLAGGALTIDQISTIANGAIQVDAAGGGTGAGKLTLSAATVTGGTVTNQSGGAIDLAGGGVIQNGSLGNAGTIKVSGSGNALHAETFTTNAMLEVLAGGALTIDQISTIANGAIRVDAANGDNGAGKLTLSTATVSGGTVTNQSGGEIDLAGSGVIQNGALSNAGTIKVSGSGNALHAETITANTMLEVLAGGVLTIDQISTIANGAIQVDAAGGGNGAGKLTLNAATVTGGTVTNQSGGEIDLAGSGAIQNGSLGNAGTIKVSGSGNALHAETITANAMLEVLAGGALTIDQISTIANGAIQVDAAGGGNGAGKLTLSATTVTGGKVTNQSGGEIDLAGGDVIQNGTLTNAGAFKASGAGNELANEQVTSNGTGTIEVSGALTLDLGTALTNATVTNTITVDSTGKLTLNGASIDRGSITNNGEIDLTGSAAVQNGELINAGMFKASGADNTLGNEHVTNNAAITVSGALTLNLGTAVTNAAQTATVTVDSAGTLTLNSASIGGGTVTNDGVLALTSGGVLKNGWLGNAGTIKVNGTGNALDGEIMTSNAALELMAGAALIIDQNSTITNNGTIAIDGGATLTLNAATISGGTINNYGAGTIDVTGSSTIDGNATLNNGAVTVEHGVTLTLGNLTVNGTAFNDIASGATLSVASGDILALQNGATVTGGSLVISGTLHLETSSGAHLDGVTVSGGGAIVVDDPSIEATLFLADGTSITDGTLTIGHVGALDVESAASLHHVNVGDGNVIDVGVTTTAVLTLDSGTTITGGALKFGDGSDHLVVEKGAYDLGATLDDVAVSGGGLIEVGVNSSGAVLTLTGSTGITGGTLSVGAADTLEIANGASVTDATLDGVHVSGSGTVQVDQSATLALNGGTISGGTLAISGELDATGSIVITSSVINTGTIELQSGTLDLKGGLSGSGQIIIDAGAKLEIAGAYVPTVTFNSPNAELQIDTATFAGKIQGLAATDKIDLGTIQYDLATTTATYVSNEWHPGGVLTVTDAHGHYISLTLTGSDYSNAHFAGSSDGHGGTLITLSTDDDEPVFTTTTPQAASFGEAENVTGSSASDPQPKAAGGSIAFTDVDLTDRPTATVTGQSAVWADTNHTFALSSGQIIALEHGFSLVPVTNTNSGAIDWTYAITDSTLDFLRVGQTVTIDSTVTLDDHKGGSDTADVVVTIVGANDEPMVAAALSDQADEGAHGFTKDLLAGATDADAGETATLHIAGVSYAVDGGTASATPPAGVSLDGHTLCVDPDNAAFNHLAVGQHSTIVVSYDVVDAQGATVAQTETITIHGTNDAPVVAATLGDDVNEGAPAFTTDLLAGATDTDAGETATLHIAGVSYAVDGGTASATPPAGVSLDGRTLHVDPGNAAFNHLAVGQHSTIVVSYDVVDAQGATVAQTETITINGTNDAPVVAAALSDSVNEGGSILALDLLTDATDPDNGETATLHIAGVSYKVNGSTATAPAGVSLGADGHTLSVDPTDPAFNHLAVGQHSAIVVSYDVVDAQGATVAQTETVTIHGTNDAPVVAAALSDSADEGAQAFTKDLLAGASDVDSGETATLQVLNVSYKVDGTVSATPPAGVSLDGHTLCVDPGNAAFNHLAVGQHSTIVVSYDVVDAQGATVAQAETITIKGTNNAPVVAATLGDDVNEGAPAFTTNLLAGATDADDGETATLHIAGVSYAVDGGAASATPPAGVSLDGHTLCVDPGNAAFNHLAVGQHSTIVVSYDVVDAQGATVAETETITIQGTNDAPVVAATLGDDVNEGAPAFTTNLLAGATDADDGETATLHIAGVSYAVDGGAASATPPAGVSLDGHTLCVDPGNPAFNHLAVGQHSTIVVSYDVVDAQGATVAQTETITIKGTDDAPVVAAALSGSADEGAQAFTKDLLAGASDVDSGETATLQVLNVSYKVDGTVSATPPAGVSIDGHTLHVDPTDPSFNHLAVGQHSTIVVSYDVVDAQAATVAQTETITIHGTNDAPVVAAALSDSAGEGAQAFTKDLLAGASDVDSGETATLQVLNVSYKVDGTVSATPPAGVSIDGHTLHVDPTDPAFNHLAVGQHSTIVVSYDVVDAQGATAAQTETITINGTNDAPVVAAALSDSINEGGSILARDLLTDATDPDNGETATLHIAGVSYKVNGSTVTAPAGVSLGADGHTLLVDPTDPAYNYLAVGQHSTIVVSYDVVDAQGATVAQTETVTIHGAGPVNQQTHLPPVIDTAHFLLAQDGNTTTITGVVVTDADAAAATQTYTYSEAAEGTIFKNGAGNLQQINRDLGSISETDSNNAKTETVSLTVKDSFGNSDSVAFVFSVGGGNGQGVTMSGGSGKDVIITSSHDDQLTGGLGADQFVFAPNSNPNTDTIQDFTQGQDRIDLRAFGTAINFETLLKNATQSGSDTTLHLDGKDILVLTNVHSALHASDFILAG